MRKEAQHFWARARECRVAADVTPDIAERKRLLQLADELETEAVKIEAETSEPT
jgi:hypothetical protein